MSSPATSYTPLVTPSDDEVLVRVEGVSKKFCRSLKKSLWYGVCDIASELNPFGRVERMPGVYKNLTTIEHLGRCENEQLKVGPKGEGVGTTESKDTESTEVEAKVRLEGQAGAEFSSPSASGLARGSENTSLIRAANNLRSSGDQTGSDSASAKIGKICGKKWLMGGIARGFATASSGQLKMSALSCAGGNVWGLLGIMGLCQLCWLWQVKSSGFRVKNDLLSRHGVQSHFDRTRT